MMPIVFLFGPSGSGKSTLAQWVAEDLRFLHIEIDRCPEDVIDVEGLRREWKAFYYHAQAAELAAALQARADRVGMAGAILSFPGQLVPSIQCIDAAEEQGFRTLILYGTRDECIDAFLTREKGLVREDCEAHWIAWNDRTESYERFGRPEYSKYRLIAFETFPTSCPIGPRCSGEGTIERLIAVDYGIRSSLATNYLAATAARRFQLVNLTS